MQTDITIIYNKFCPYAQRALIAAIEKDVNAKFITTGLGDDSKTPFLKEAYARAVGRDPKSEGKVPVLIHGNRYITESELVCWYLAESFSTGSQLIPANNLKRLKMRVWISQINAHMISIFDRAKLKQIGPVEDFLAEVEAFLQKVENNIEGSYLLGEEISLADVLIYPWFERWVILEHFFSFPIPGKYGKVRQWLESMGKRRSVVETKKLTDNKYYIERTNKMMAAQLAKL
jgi:glutathione S-transferase